MSLNRFAQVQSFDELSPLQLAKLEQQMYADGGSASNVPSNLPRKQSQAKQAAKAFVRGAKYMPQDLLGAPVDLINLGLTAIGKGSDKPVGGSDWLIDKSNQYFPSVVPKRTGEGYETAGRAAVALVNPAGAVRTATKGVQKVAPHLAEAAYNAAQKNILGIPGTAPYQEMKLFVGENSANWNKSAAKEAEKLLKKGVAPEEVWKKTGMLKGLGDDRKLRHEISDANSKVLIGPKEATPNKEYKMSEVLDHPELYKNYPEFKNTPVRYEKMGFGDAGYFDSDTGKIALNSNIIPKDAREALLHEVQHKIQQKEKFRPGGNLTEVEDASRKYYAKEGIDADDLDNFDDWFDAHSAYERLPGETEARLVSDRASLTPKQLKENYPHQQWTSEKQYGLDRDPDEIFDPRDFDKAGNQISFKKSPLAAPAIIKEPVIKKQGPLSREQAEAIAQENAKAQYGYGGTTPLERAELMGFNPEHWYHGSPSNDIEAFNLTRGLEARKTNPLGAPKTGGAIWITNDPRTSDSFTGYRRGPEDILVPEKHAPTTYPLMHRAKNIFDPAKDPNEILDIYRQRIDSGLEDPARFYEEIYSDPAGLGALFDRYSRRYGTKPEDFEPEQFRRFFEEEVPDRLRSRTYQFIEDPSVVQTLKDSGYSGVRVSEPGKNDYVVRVGRNTGSPSQNIMLFDPTVLRSPNAVFDPALIDSANLMHAEGGIIS